MKEILVQGRLSTWSLALLVFYPHLSLDTASTNIEILFCMESWDTGWGLIIQPTIDYVNIQ